MRSEILWFRGSCTAMITEMNGFRAEDQDGLRIYRFSSLASQPGVLHGVTTRLGGVSEAPYRGLNLGFGSGDSHACVEENRRRLASAVGLDPRSFRTVQQVHGTAIAVLHSPRKGARGSIRDNDSLATRLSGVTLLVLSADCALILFYDPVSKGIAAVHAGWRGTVAGAAAAAVRCLSQAFGSHPADLLAGIGPAIGPCCYEIDGPVIRAVQSFLPEDADAILIPKTCGKAHLDLWEANRRQLLRAGVPSAAISVAGICTRCRRDEFYSQRAEGAPTGRFGAFIALVP